MAEDWAKIDELDAEKRVIKNRMKELKESKAVYQGLFNCPVSFGTVYDRS